MNGFTNNFISYFRETAEGLKHIKDIRLSLIRKVFSLMGKREKIALILLLVVAVVNLFFSSRNIYYNVTTPVPASGGSYTEGALGQPVYLNPLLAYQEPDLSLIRLIFSGLYKYDASGNITPDLAASLPVISEDQKQYTIQLRNNVYWHNNLQFTAEDVVFTYNTLKNPAYKSPYSSLWQTTTVEKADDYTVKFTTKNISGPFLDSLTLPIISKAQWDSEQPATFALSSKNLYAIGTGPYVIKKIQKLQSSGKVQSITLGSFDDYFSEKAKIETVTIKFYDTEQDLLNSFHSREIQGFGYVQAGSDLFLEESSNGASVYKAVLPQYQIMFFNTQNKILGDRAVRHALASSIDKQRIIDEAYKGNAVLPSWPMSSPTSTAISYDLEAAKKELDAAGWVVDPKTNIRSNKGTPLELTISTNDYFPNSKTAEELARAWQELNVKANVNITSTKELNDNVIKARAFDVLVFPEKFSADPDPFVFWHSTQSKDPGLNLTNYQNAEADKLLTQARTTTNTEVRYQQYQQFYRLLDTDVPAVFLNQTQFVYVLSPQIKNVQMNVLYDPSHRFYNLPSWYMEEKRTLK